MIDTIEALRRERDEWKIGAQEGRKAQEKYMEMCVQLAASQAREQQLREALEKCRNLCEHPEDITLITKNALALHHDGDTALKQYGAKLLRDAAEWFDNNWCDDPVAYRLNRMADELESQ